jgi:hypothetical protein
MIVRKAINVGHVRWVSTRLAGKFGSRQILAVRQPPRGDIVDRGLEIAPGSSPYLNSDFDTLIGVDCPDNLCAGKRAPTTSRECNALFHDESPQWRTMLV